jgi:IgA Peptidase M64
MARFVFSIPPDLLRPQGAFSGQGAGLTARSRRASRTKPTTEATLQWETAEGRSTRAPIKLRVSDTVMLEAPGGRGRMSWKEKPTSPVFSDEPPEDATALRLSVPGRATVRIPRAALAATAVTPLPQPQTRRFGEAGASFIVPVFSERFAVESEFMDRVEQLHESIMGQAPFKSGPAGSNMALVAHFWPSDPETGLFDTSDDKVQDGRLFFGDRARAKMLLDPFIATAKVSLILIDSEKRGGAGGVPGFSAWTSITSADNERWEDVSLHEIGHGFGLADEYLDTQREYELPGRLEPNISKDPRPSHAPWSASITVADAPAPTIPLNGPDNTPIGTVGTFQGARYRKDLFRAMSACLMRDTRDGFCVVCQKHIETVLSTPLIS